MENTKRALSYFSLNKDLLSQQWASDMLGYLTSTFSHMFSSPDSIRIEVKAFIPSPKEEKDALALKECGPALYETSGNSSLEIYIEEQVKNREERMKEIKEEWFKRLEKTNEPD